MSPNKPQKDNNKGNKPQKNGGKGNRAGKGVVVNKAIPILPPPDVPTEKLSLDTPPLDAQKWCFKDTLIFQPVIEKWVEKENGTQGNKDIVKSPIPVEEQSSFRLTRNTVVDVLPQDVSISWSGIAIKNTIYDFIDPKKTGKKDWVTTKVVGWVSNDLLDDYVEEFRDFEVSIHNATRNSTDLEQDMTIEDEGYDEIRARYNMCGELCVTFIVKEDIDPKVSIDDVLKKWKGSGVRNKEGINTNYASLVGRGRDKSLEQRHLKEILDLYNTGDVNKKVEPYSVVGEKKMPLALSDYDDRHASKDFQEKLLQYYFIALLTIDPNTGELILNMDPKKRNHWVVVDRISHNGVRVELYNPAPNKRQSYSFRELYASVGSNPNSGWWVERNQLRHKDDFGSPSPEVAIENATPDEKDAEQYILVDRLKKTNLCGEFSVAYILKSSLDKALKHWFDNQVALKMNAKGGAGIWELATVLQAFGLNTTKAGAQSYSIDKILKYWKAIQPDLYGSILGSSNNETTGPLDLITILKAYGYTNKDDYKFGGLALSPGASAEMLKSYFLIAGVKIDTKKNGRLKNKLGDGVDHWVVVNEITPNGSLVGGNGGWVQLYNPFTNVMEEYSYKEFLESFSGAGLWVTKDVHPTFTWQARVSAKDKSKKPKGNSKVVVNKIPEANLRREIQKKKDTGTTSLNSIANMLANPKLGFGWSRTEILKLLKNPEAESTRVSLAEVERLLCTNLEIGSLACEISRWIRNTSGENSSFAVELAFMLREFGILVIENKKNGKIIKPDDPQVSIDDKRGRMVTLKDLNSSADRSLSDILQASLTKRFVDSVPASQLAHKVASAFMDQTVEQITKIPPTVLAYKNLAEYVEWEKTIDVPGSNIYRVRRWGDPKMTRYGFNTNEIATGNFQAVGLYNGETGFGAVTNYIRIERGDIDQLIDMQFDEIVDGRKMTVEDKMNWLCQLRGRIYMFDSGRDSWQRSLQIRWGTIALGGNLVQVVERKEMDVKIPGEKKISRHWMARLAGFRKSDWSRPLDELLAEGLVHRCFVANDGNVFADTSRGIVYSPFYSLLDWDFGGSKRPDALWIPFEYLEDKIKSKSETSLEVPPNQSPVSDPKPKPKPKPSGK